MSGLRICAVVGLLVFTCPVSVLAANMFGGQSQNEGMTAVPKRGDVTVDGKLDEWDFSGRIWMFADKSVRDTYSVEVAAMYDADALYLGMKWRDATPLFNLVDPQFNPENGWKSDSIQMRVASPDQTTWFTAWQYTTRRQPVLHTAVWKESANARGGQNITVRTNESGGADLGDGVQLAYLKNDTGDGYSQELRIPWKLIYATVPEIKPGNTIHMGFECLYGDSTGKVWPGHRYADNVQPGNTRREFFWSAIDAWGDLTLGDANDIPVREYISEEDRLTGAAPIRVNVPLDAKRVSLAINDETGTRVRNIGGIDVADYTIQTTDKSRMLEILWDGLTDPMKEGSKAVTSIVPPGAYTVRGLYHTGIDAKYEQAFYNPGTPTWETVDGTGAWGADHAPPLRVVATGDSTVVSWQFAEGGSGIVGVNAIGRKAWGEKRGGEQLAANESYVFAVPDSWHIKEELLIRLDAKTGKYAPFMRDGKERPFELPTREIFDDNVPGKIIGMAVGKQGLALAMSGGELVLLDTESAVIKSRARVAGIGSIAFGPDGALYGIIGQAVQRIDLSSGALQAAQTPGVERYGAIAVDRDGNLLVADTGADSQVKAFSPDGQLVYTCGKQGGRAIRGKFDPQAMMRMSSIAVDARGHVWVVENWNYPRRVSVWNRDGSLVRDYLGGTGYAGTGSYLHQTDPTLGYVGPLEFKLNKADRSWELQRILWVPDETKGERFEITTGTHVLPQRFDRVVNGVTRKYLFAGPYRNWEGYTLYMERPDGQWRPVAAVTLVGQISGKIDGKGALAFPPSGEFAGLDAFDGVFWSDRNDDGIVQRDECEIVPTKKPTTKFGTRGTPAIPIGGGWGVRMDSNFRFFADGLTAYAPVSITDDGVPIYIAKSMAPLAIKDRGDLVPHFTKPTLFALSFAGYPNITEGLRGIDVSSPEGRVLWRYPNVNPGVHGSHRAAMPKPGMFIGPLKITGIANVNDQVGDVIHLRGNLGQDAILTGDGIFVASLFQDARLPGASLPADEASLVGTSVGAFSMSGEPFNGWFGKHDDGVIRLTSALARQACTILQVTGLESIRSLPVQSLHVDETLAARFASDRADAIVKAAVTNERAYTIARIASPLTIDGKASDWGNTASLRIEREGSSESATLRMAYDEEKLFLFFDVRDETPWRNDAKDLVRLFKTGDTVDLQLRGTDDRVKDPKPGDVRLFIAPLGKEPAAVVMKPFATGDEPGQRQVYSSPVQTYVFERVAKADTVESKVVRGSGGYTVEAAVPWSVLGLTPKPGETIRGDVGITASDSAVTTTVSRIYWSNPRTNLVNDEPAEAWLYPEYWGAFTLGR